jgi:hypothetical protein
VEGRERREGLDERGSLRSRTCRQAKEGQKRRRKREEEERKRRVRSEEARERRSPMGSASSSVFKPLFAQHPPLSRISTYLGLLLSIESLLVYILE